MVVTVAFLMVMRNQCVAADEPATMVRFSTGEYVTGELLDTSDPKLITLQSTAFATPLQFMVRQIQHIEFPRSPPVTDFAADYRFELNGGDVLLGSVVELNEEHAILDVLNLGQIRIAMSTVCRIQPWKNPSGLVFHGPGELKDWEAGLGWSEDGKHIHCDADTGSSIPEMEVGQTRPRRLRESVIRRDLELPTRGRMEFILSWQDSADFEFRVGTGDGFPVARFEIWNDVNNGVSALTPSDWPIVPQARRATGSLVVMRDVEWARVQSSRDSLFLKSITSGPGRVHLQMYFDQEHETTHIFTSSGQSLGELAVRSTKPVTRRHVELIGHTHDIRLERIDVGQWSGEVPKSEIHNQARLLMTDGFLVYGRLVGFDVTRREFILAREDGEKRVPETSVQDITIPRRPVFAPEQYQAEMISGNRISGTVARIGTSSVHLKSSVIHEEIILPRSSLRSLTAWQSRPSPADLQRRLGYPRGRMEIPGHLLLGRFLDTETIEDRRLIFKPDLSQTASAIHPTVTGRLVYRDRTHVSPKESPQQGQPPQKVIRTDAPNSVEPPSRLRKPVVHLASGDQVPCFHVTLNEQGATISSTYTDSTHIKFSEIRGIDLVRGIPAMPSGLKIDRFMVLPRSQRNDPPTHLIQSMDGDLLRGRIVAMDQSIIQVALRNDIQRVPLDSVARIIALSATDGGVDVVPDPAEGMPVTVVMAGGSRLSFAASQVAGIFLSGRSPILGDCRGDLQQVDEIQFGAKSGKAETDTWTFRPAINPLGSDEGQVDQLIGTIAADFELLRLNGGRLKLSDYNGKIVVLDFWASWCAPCLQIMPQVDKVAREFADQGVVLMSINLGERPEQIQAVMNRLKLSTTVLLESDGRTAARFGATTIPLTVIIGRDGRIASLFVGSGARFSDQLRDALKAVTGKRPQTERLPE